MGSGVESRQPGRSEQRPPDPARAEQTSLEARHLSPAIFDAIHAPVAYLDPQLKVIRVNRAYAELQGRALSEYAGRYFFDLDPNAEAEKIFRRVVETGEAHKALAARHQHSRHPERPMSYWDWSLVPVKDPAGTVTGLVLTLTERRRADKALAASEERLRRMIEASPIGIRIDQDARYVYVNPSCVERCGYSRAEDILGLPVEALYVPEDHERIRQCRAQLLAGAPAPLSCHARGLRKGGEPFDAITWITAFDHEGRPAILSFVIDTSVESSLRAQLLHAQKLEAVGALAGGIAHDFNNLLQAVQGHAQLLLLGKGPEHPEHGSLEAIFDAARKGAELTRQLLTFSRKGRSQKQVLDSNRIVDEACALLRRTLPRMIEIECVLGKDLRPVSADPLQLQQVLMNLGVNAKDAMPDGGRITVRTETVHLDARCCQERPGLAPGQHLLLSFSDTGAGMTPETVEHIFEPLYTTRGPGRGTGLGLAIVYGIVKDHGGFIECQSDRETGTCFRLYLPVIGTEPAAGPSRPARDLPGGSETVLVVDDEPAVRDIGQQMLTRYGYTVLAAPDGERALEIYRQDPARIHLIILDLVMPGMGGRRCLEALREVNPKVKVLLASGYSPDAPTDVALGWGARGFIQKPYALAEILGTVRAVLDAP